MGHKTNDVNQLSKTAEQTVRSLEALESYLHIVDRELRNEQDSYSEIIFMVDWDVVQMFVEFRLSRSVFAASMIHAFDERTKHDMRVIVPQGTRMEFAHYVGKHLPSSLRLLSDSDIIDTPPKEGLYAAREYELEKAKIWRARNASVIASMLNRFAQTHAKAISSLQRGSFTSMALDQLKETPEFKNALVEVKNCSGRRGKRRIDADAANIAILDIATSQKLQVKLVSATTIINKLRPNLVMTPLSFLIRTRISSPGSGETRLAAAQIDAMKVRVIELRQQSTAVLAATKNRKFQIYQRECKTWIKHLRKYENDPILGKTIQIVSRARADADTRMSLWNREDLVKSSDTAEVDFDKIRHSIGKACQIVGSMYHDKGDLLQDLEFKWTTCSLGSRGLIRRLTDRYEKLIISLSVAHSYIVFSWPTLVDLNSFIHSASTHLLAEKESMKNVTIRTCFDKGLTTTVLNKNDILKSLNRQNEVVANSFRFYCQDLQCFYTLGDNDLSTDPTITIVFETERIDDACNMYQDTFGEYVPSNIIKEQIAELREKIQCACGDSDDQYPDADKTQ